MKDDVPVILQALLIVVVYAQPIPFLLGVLRDAMTSS